MANTFITPSLIAKLALHNLYANAVMPGLVWRDFDPDFAGKQGDTVTVRIPATFTAQEFSSSITVQNATETSTSVVLNKLLDVSFGITAKELTLNIDEINQRLVMPAMEAMNQKVDNLLLGLRTDVSNNVGTASVTPTDPTILIDAGKLLSDANVPMQRRVAVIDTAAEAEFLRDPLFHQADKRGDTEGLRNAQIGRKFGFDVFVDQNISDGDGVAFHPTAFVLATRALQKPLGVPDDKCAIVQYKGMGLRVVMDYDVSSKTDTVSIDMLCGVKTTAAARAVEILG